MSEVHSILSAVFAWAWQTSLAVVVLTVLILVLDVVFQRAIPPQWRYALWFLVVVRLLMPATPPSPLSIFNLSSAFTTRTVPARPDPAGARLFPAHSEGQGAPRHRTSEALPSFRFATHAPRLQPRPALLVRIVVGAIPVCWLAGALGFLLVVGWQHWQLARWVRRQPPVDNERILSVLASARATIGLKSSASVQVIVTGILSTPAIFGFRKPRLVLPRAMLEKMGDDELRLVMLHELVHVRRGDVAWNWLLIGLQAVHWFNPAVWFAFRRLRAAREMVCDATVLRHLSSEQRRDYGQTLIKLLDLLARVPIRAGLLPILNQKTEIQRRIVMISNYHPGRRLASAISALALALVAYVTFTGAAEPGANKKEPAAASPKTAQRAKDSQRVLDALRKQLDNLNSQVREAQAQLDEVQIQLGIPSYIAEGNGSGTDATTAQRLQALAVEARAEFQKIDSLYSALKELPRTELKKAATTAAPDQQLSSLFDNLAAAEQKLALMADRFAPDHPEMKSLMRVLDQINKQIEDRLDGILTGLRAKHASSKARLAQFEREIDAAQKYDIDSSIKRRRFFENKRELENLRQVRDRLQIRFLQERIDAEIPLDRDPEPTKP